MRDDFDSQIKGQITLEDLYEPPARLVAVSNIFARARKNMSLNEQKAFVYALTQVDFTKSLNDEFIRLDKKTLANVLGLTTDDPDHLSQNLYDELKDITKHSYIEIADRDLGLYSNGFIISAITKFRNIVRLRLNGEYLPLFTNLGRDYITMWSSDVFKMHTKRSVQFYEFLRQKSYSEYQINGNMYSYGMGIKAIKEMFDIPKEGKGSYMREKGGFNRTEFEKKVIIPMCEDLMATKMITLAIQPDGKPYEKVKRGNKVLGYRFYWYFSATPAVVSAEEIKSIPELRDPEVAKIAKDIAKGKQSQKSKNGFKNAPERDNSILDYTKLIEQTPITEEE